MPADLARAADLLAGPAPARRTGFGHDAIRSGRASRCASAVSRSRRPAPPRSLRRRRRRSTPSPTPSSAPRPGRPGRLFPADASTPAGIDEPRAARAVAPRLASAGWRPVGGGPHVVGRPAAARGHAGRDASEHRRAPGPRPRAPSASRHRPATSMAPKAPDGRSRRSPRHDRVAAMTTSASRTRSPARPARSCRCARRRPHLLLRPDGLWPGAHRQLPLVPVRRPARATPALARPHGPLGHEHHRHRRQDHPRRRRRGVGSSSSPSAISSASWPTQTRCA